MDIVLPGGRRVPHMLHTVLHPFGVLSGSTRHNLVTLPGFGPRKDLGEEAAETRKCFQK